MKKILFFIILAGIAFELKAQQKPAIKPLEKVTASNFRSIFDSLALRPRLSIKPNSNADLQFLPGKNSSSNILIASLDKMPIVKPVGKWNMPVAKPDESTRYKMPVKRLSPVIKPDSSAKNINP
ncbi:hypothetical protein [Mucilaginibacter arboris]|uniref:Uncharacterized protein n=1 Tax=Mucilaginibacter arboris TaxID=2682090 RepID=A0A7K1STU0_9SPHI|nr:hypothetical protein [Mucilaginibacter arboris]MVN20678.1 hypothetical protein [Mucilaginibacter arboris]